MSDSDKTSLNISSDKATGISTSVHGANINTVGFNIDLIASKRPTKAVEIIDLYNEVKDITPDTPVQPDEDFGLAADKIRSTLEGIDS